MDFHKINGSNSGALASTFRISVSVPRRLVDKGFDSQQTNLSHKILSSSGTEPRLHTKSVLEWNYSKQNLVRVPADRVDSLILTIKTFLSQTQVSARTFLSLLGKLSAAADFILLGRLHL